MPVMPEDLINTVVADALRRGICLYPTYPRWKRAWLEPLFNLAGIAWGQVMVMLPWTLRRRMDPGILFRLGGNKNAIPADINSRTQEAVAMARRLRQATGQWPATLILTSHPPTIGPLEWLRFELLRLGLMMAGAVVDVCPDRPASPQCFVAIDPFALDTLNTPTAGFYAGWMHRLYLAWDRQSASQGWLQRHLLLRRSGYPHIAWRLLHRLQQDIPVVMVLPGGLPYNARLLYTAKEFVQRLPVNHWPLPKRQTEKKMIDILIEPVGGILPAEGGEIPASTRHALNRLLEELGLVATERERALEEFQAEFRQAVPYRERLFRFLINRLVQKKKPLLLIAITHNESEPRVRIMPPWGVYGDGQGRPLYLKNSTAAAESLPETATFAKEFSRLY